MRTVTKRPVSRDELDQFVREHVPALTFDGMRYTHPVKMNGCMWNRPVAYVDADGKCFVIEDV